MDISLPVPSPFGLPMPSVAWQSEVGGYDADLRIFPSQIRPTYRLMRVARMSGGLDPKVFLTRMAELHPDTRIAVANKLVPVTSLPLATVQGPASILVAWLKAHDLQANGGAERVSDRLEQADAARDVALDREQAAHGQDVHRAARIGYQYRTGARLSLAGRGVDVVSPPVSQPPETPGGRETAVSVSTE